MVSAPQQVSWPLLLLLLHSVVPGGQQNSPLK